MLFPYVKWEKHFRDRNGKGIFGTNGGHIPGTEMGKCIFRMNGKGFTGQNGKAFPVRNGGKHSQGKIENLSGPEMLFSI